MIASINVLWLEASKMDSHWVEVKRARREIMGSLQRQLIKLKEWLGYQVPRRKKWGADLSSGWV